MTKLTDTAEALRVLMLAEEQVRENTTARQIREIVPIDKWLDNEYYIGPDGARIYDFWKEEMIDIFQGGQKYNEVIMECSLGCLPVGTRYWTSVGYLNLEEIQNLLNQGKEVRVASEGGTQRVISTGIKGRETTIRIRLSNGQNFVASKDHRIRVIENGEIVWKEMQHLSLSDALCLSEVEEQHSQDVYNPELSYLMGYIYGDGGRTSNETYVLWTVGQNNDEELQRLTTKYMGVTPHTHERNGWKYRAARKWKWEESDKWGTGNSHNKRIPAWFLSKSREDLGAFIAGLLDADGYIGPTAVELTLASRKLITQLQLLLSSLGIHSTVRHQPKKSRLHITGKNSWKRLLRLSPPHLTHKREALEALASRQRTRNERTTIPQVGQRLAERNRYDNCQLGRSGSHLSSWKTGKQNITREALGELVRINPQWFSQDKTVQQILRDEIRVVYVESIEKGEDLVGDIEVENTHAYTRSGIISHNTGKTTVATYILIRKLYEMSCYKNVASMYGLMSTASTFMMYLSPALTQAQMTGFGQMRSALDTIPYFQREFVREDKISSILKYPERIVITAGSSTGHQIGTNLIASILDESNFFSGGKISSPDALTQVAHLHNSIVTRGQSRFLRAGVNNSLSILISSPTYKSSYTQGRIEKSVGDPTVKVIHGSLWTIKGRHLYSPKTFPVFVGNDRLDPFMLRTTEDLNAILSAQGEPTTEETDLEKAIAQSPQDIQSRIDHVPEDFRKQYENALIQSLQDISGISVNPIGRLFSSRAILSQAIDEDLPNWFTKTEMVISTLDNSDSNSITYYLRKDTPMQYEKPTHMHIDQSVTTDSTGVAGAHKSGYVERDGQRLPVVTVDFALRVLPPSPPKQISITRIRSFTLYLYKTIRLNPGKITYDQYQSTESRQVLQENGLDGDYQSVDKDDTQYLNLINMLQDGRLKVPRQVHDLMAQEIFDLIHYRDRKKVDHPDGGRKDVMDAVVGAVWNAVNDEEASKKEKAESDSKVIAEINREQPEELERVITMSQLLYGYNPRR